MENASKALIMAAGVLIGILILSLAVFLFVDFGSTSSQIYDEVEVRQLAQYNAQYTIYAGRDNITIYDIITLANLAKENNDYYEAYTDYENTYQVRVILNATPGSNANFQNTSMEAKQELLKEYSQVNEAGELIQYFKCERRTELLIIPMEG